MRASAQSLLSLDALSMASECLKTIAHPHRLRMIQMLLDGEHTVGELAQGVARVLEYGPKVVRISRVASVDVADGPVFIAEQSVVKRPAGIEPTVERRELL